MLMKLAGDQLRGKLGAKIFVGWLHGTRNVVIIEAFLKLSQKHASL